MIPTLFLNQKYDQNQDVLRLLQSNSKNTLFLCPLPSNQHTQPIIWYTRNWIYSAPSLSIDRCTINTIVRRAQKTKSRGPKGLQLEVGPGTRHDICPNVYTSRLLDLSYFTQKCVICDKRKVHPSRIIFSPYSMGNYFTPSWEFITILRWGFFHI